MRFTFARLSTALVLSVVGCHHAAEHGLVDAGPVVGADMAVTPVQDAGPPVSTDMSGPLVLSPLNQVITIAPGATTPGVNFTATVNGIGVDPAWTIDRGEIGQIIVGTGAFSPAGTLGGKATITATYQGETASTSVTVVIAQTQNGDPAYPPTVDAGAGGYGGVGGGGPAGGASPTQTGVLTGTPTAPDTAVHILYPYDGTVWPRGLLAPLIAWDPSANHTFDAVLIKLHEANFDYTGTFAANATPFINIPIPDDVWHTLSYSNNGQGDDVSVSLTFEDTKSGTPTAIGPYTMTWHIAPGTLKGTVYYNSYGTALVADPTNPANVGNSGEPSCATTDTIANCTAAKPVRTGPQFGAATLAIKPGDTAPSVVAGTYSANMTGCRVCHSVSANGSTLLTQHGDNYDVSSLFQLTNSNAQVPVAGTGHAFPALAPDGSWFMSDSGAMINGDSKSEAWTAAGVLMATQPTLPWDSFKAALPVFSPDGKHLSFNYQSSTTSGTTTSDGKSMAVLDYDAATTTFSNFRLLDEPAKGVDSWSSFLPTSDAVVFEHEITSTHFGYTWQGGTGELMWSTTASAAPVALAQLNGAGYLPSFGAHTGAADATLNYEPTVNPVVSGGYAWVVFTSRRLYANIATIDAKSSDPRLYHWLDKTQYTPKKLWVAAIDLNAPAGTDPSHPAFYLPGQELIAGNARGFWTVDPCHADGTSCESGDECCGGYCRPPVSGGDGGTGLICTDQQPSCSQEFEKCTVDSDCCGVSDGFTCINGLCSNNHPIS